MQRHKITISVFSGLLILFTNTVIAQRTVPTAYATGIPKSYVRSWDVTRPGISHNNLSAESLKDVKQVTQYVDGLGRPIQTVVKEGSLETTSEAKKRSGHRARI